MKEKTVNPDDRAIGANIRAIRTTRGLSQEKLGEALGVTFQQVQKYEKGTNRVSGSRLIQISKALSCTLEQIFSGTDGSTSKPIPLLSLSPQASRLATEFDRIKSTSTRAKLMALITNLADEDNPVVAKAA